jgi:TatA/E family protein of Tat protein translocase
MFFGHLTEIVALVFIGLLVFGPKKMIDIAAALGRAVRELREATKDLSWQELTGMGSPTETPRQTAMSKLSQFSQAVGLASELKSPVNPAAPASTGETVEGSVEPELQASTTPSTTNATAAHDPAAPAPSADGQPSA